MAIKTIEAKLGRMRKPQKFVVYPPKIEDPTKPVKIIVQANSVIGQFDPATRQGVLNTKAGKSCGFAHLTSFLGAEPYEFPKEFVDQVLDALPHKGDEIGPGVIIG